MTGKNMNFPTKNENEILDWEFKKPYGEQYLEGVSKVSKLGLNIKTDIKTDSPKQVVAIFHFTTISGHFLANPFNILYKTEALIIQKD